jgi:hypothetical protein
MSWVSNLSVDFVLSKRMSIVGDVPAVPLLPGISSNATVPGRAQLTEEQDARWITDFTDDLTVIISLRNWSAAVDLVLQGAFPYIAAL